MEIDRLSKTAIYRAFRCYFYIIINLRPGITLSSSWHSGNRVIYSRLHELAHARTAGTTELGIKYVLKGCEHYTLNKKTYSIKEGSYLLVNEGQVFDTILDYSREQIKGLCIYINKELLNDVYRNYNATSSTVLLDDPSPTGRSFDFFEAIYRPDDVLSQYLAGLEQQLDPVTGQLQIPDDELYYRIAERLLQSQSAIGRQVSQICAERHHTRVELYQRVSKARQMIDDGYASRLDVAGIARAVALSEFHFFRVFKQAYGISPHQYHIRRKLEIARKQLLEGQLTITEIAHLSGFGDIYTFSRSFKKAFLVSPSRFRESLQP